MAADNTKRFFTNSAFMTTESINAANAAGRQYMRDLREARERRDLLRAQATLQVDINLAEMEQEALITGELINHWPVASWPALLSELALGRAIRFEAGDAS